MSDEVLLHDEPGMATGSSDVGGAAEGSRTSLRDDPVRLETRRDRLGRAFLTPAEEMFVCQHNPVPAIEAETWTVTVSLHGRPTAEVSVSDLHRFDHQEVTSALECAGNGRAYFEHRLTSSSGFTRWGVGAVANVRWRGVPVAGLLEHLDLAVPCDASWLNARGGDARLASPTWGALVVERSIPLRKAMADAMVVTSMNGERLTPEDGGPVRLVVPGYYGVNNVKFLDRLDLTSSESTSPLQSRYYRQRPVGDAASVEQPSMYTMPVKSVVTEARLEERGTDRVLEVHGVAWSGRGPVRSVRLSVDAGASWSAAELIDPVVSPFSWRRFRGTVAVASSQEDVTVHSCARDADGDTQPRLRLANERGYGNNAWADHGMTCS